MKPTLVPSDLMHLIPGFLERREKEIAELTGMLKARDYGGIRDIGHRLKGTGVGYGFPVISRIGGELETAGKSENSAQAKSCIEELAAVTLNLRTLFSERQ